MTAGETVQRLLATALTAADPGAAIATAADDPRLSDDDRRMIAAIDRDGFRISAMLVARLRLERLLHGHPAVDDWLARDPEGFTEVFRRYHASVLPEAFFPPEEARAFDAWLSATGTAIPSM